MNKRTKGIRHHHGGIVIFSIRIFQSNGCWRLLFIFFCCHSKNLSQYSVGERIRVPRNMRQFSDYFSHHLSV